MSHVFPAAQSDARTQPALHFPPTHAYTPPHSGVAVHRLAATHIDVLASQTNPKQSSSPRFGAQVVVSVHVPTFAPVFSQKDPSWQLTLLPAHDRRQ